MNRKKWPAAAGAALLCLALTGCGSAGGEQRVSSGGQQESGPVQVQETQIMEGQTGEETSAGEIDRTARSRWRWRMRRCRRTTHTM